LAQAAATPRKTREAARATVQLFLIELDNRDTRSEQKAIVVSVDSGAIIALISRLGLPIEPPGSNNAQGVEPS
jgi:hypothetical protein